MNPVVQLERTGCGIASVAAIIGLSYQEARQAAESLGIFANDRALWTETTHVRTLLNHFGARASLGEIPFSSWVDLPNLALLSVKWRLEKGVPLWHWVVFVRQSGKACVLDSKEGLLSNLRTDFGRMRPKWYIPVILEQNSREVSFSQPDFRLMEKGNSVPDRSLMDFLGPMAFSGNDEEDLKKLEESLWLPEIRFSREKMEEILAEGFFEFGSSGRIYDKHDTILIPPHEIGAKFPFPDFSARLLSSSVALVTYQSILQGSDGSFHHALRSSVWRRTDRGWKLIFHQGTPLQSS